MIGKGSPSALRPGLVAVSLLVAVACKGRPPLPATGSFVLCETPGAPLARTAPGGALDARYPAGSRVVLALPGRTAEGRVLSGGLIAAGEPVVSPDGRRIVFSARAGGDAWQIYEASLSGGLPRSLTKAEGGASSPALLADGTLIFVSPIAQADEGWFPAHPAALWAQSPAGEPARQLTFGTASVADPTVLEDGRILYVSAQPGSSPVRLALFAVNNDGTGVLAYACQHDGAPVVRRPRELFDGRVAFLASDFPSADGSGRPEAVLAARPFRSRGPLFPDRQDLASAIEPAGGGEMLVSLDPNGPGALAEGTSVVLRAAGEPARPLDLPGLTRKSATPISARRGGSGTVLVGLKSQPEPETGWRVTEAVPLAPRPKPPMGRLSTVDPSKKTGVIVCLNARRTERGDNDLAVARVRFLTGTAGAPHALGELPVAADGSFLAEVPADTPLGIEALDAHGKVLRTLAPSIWVRPGESRGCIGCHEPHGFAPRNHRPLAAKALPVRIGSPASKTTPQAGGL